MDHPCGYGMHISEKGDNDESGVSHPCKGNSHYDAKYDET